jgi:hypothetical protein
LLLAAVGAAASSRQWQLLSGNWWTINELTVGVRRLHMKEKERSAPCLVCLKVPSFFILSSSHQFLTVCMEY